MREPILTPTVTAGVPKLSRLGVCRSLGISDGQLKGMLDRKVVTLGDHNPGTGIARLFSVSDTIKIAVAVGMARIGVPMRHLASFADLVDRRFQLLMQIAEQKTVDATRPGLRWMLFPSGDREGRWNAAEVYRDDPIDPTKWPTAYAVLEVDEIITDTVRRVVAFAKGEDIAEREVIANLHKNDGRQSDTARSDAPDSL